MNRGYDPRDRDSVVGDLESPDEDVRRLAVERAALLPAAEGLPLLAGQLGDASWRVRKAAVESLVASPDVARVTVVLVEALADADNPGRRNSAVEALVSAGSSMLPALLDAARDPDADVRKFAIDALAGIGDAQAASGLVHALQDEDPNVRAAAADALGATRSTVAAGALLERATDAGEDVTVRFSALSALSVLEEPVHSRELAGVLDDPTLCAAGMELLGRCDADAAATDRMLKALQASSRGHREAAMGGLLRALAHCDGTESQELVRRVRDVVEPESVLLADALERLDEADGATRLRLIQFLGLLGRERVVVPILRCARERGFAELAIDTLAQMGDAAGRALDEAWEQLDAAARRDACAVLGATTGTAGCERLLAGLDDPDPEVRIAAAQSLGARRMAPALEPLLDRLEALADSGDADPEEEGAALVAAVVGIVMPLEGDDSLHSRVIVRLRDWLDGPADVLRLAVAALLAGIGRAEDSGLITLLLRDPSAQVRRAAVDAVVRLGPEAASEPLRLALVDESSRVRMAAVMALGASPVESSVDDLARIAEDDDAWVRAAAVRALGARYPGDSDPERSALVMDVLTRALRDEVLVALGVVEALLEIGGEAALEVRELLERDEPELVKEAIGCLEAHAPSEALDVLLALVEHREWSVRAEAMRALGSRGVARGIPAILARLQAEQDEFVREAGLRALERLEP